MGVFDKFKKILFDEEIEEVPTNEELPERTPKKNFRSESGFVDHSAQKEEDVIKEVVYSPKGESEGEFVGSRTSRYAEDEYEKKEVIPRQISRYEDTKASSEQIIHHEVQNNHVDPGLQSEVKHTVEEPVRHENRYDFGSDFDRKPVQPVQEPVVKKEVEDTFVQTDKYGLRRDYKAILRNETVVRHGELEHKDYAAIVKEKNDDNLTKKPFVVTPVISPVYGILDKNYTPDSVIERNKKVEEPKIDDIEVIIEEKEIVKPKEDEYMDSIKSIIDEDIPKKTVADVEDAIEDTEEYRTVQPEIIYDEPEVEIPVEVTPDVPIEEDPIIPQEQVEVPQEEYYEEPPQEEDFEAPSVSIDTLIDNPMEEEEELPKAKLDDTIETDLFNLIDSMYTKEDEGE